MRWIKWLDTMVAVIIVALVVVARGPALMAQTVNANSTCGSVACGSGMTNSPHDFSSRFANFTNSTTNVITQVQYGMCTRCHTPHHAITTALLWNHNLSTSSFSWDIPSTTAGTNYPTGTWDTYKGPSAKCESCHDGTVSTSNINWFNGGTPDHRATGFGATSGITIGYAGNMAGIHPVAMPYPCNGAANTYNGSTTGGAIVSADWHASPLAPIIIYQQDGSGNVTRANATCTGTNNGIECTSCHDVHNKQNIDMYLLRGYFSGNSANYICEECHNK